MIKRLLILIIGYFLISPTLYGQNNIVSNTQDCSSTRPPFSFDISPYWSSERIDINNGCTPLVGDLDGDGITEVIALTTGAGNIVIFDGPTGKEKGSIAANINYPTPYTICDVDNDGKAEILALRSSSSVVTLYEITSRTADTIIYGVRWSVSLTSHTGFGNICLPYTADLDGDGYPEFIVGKSILDRFGNEKAWLPLGGRGLFSFGYPCVADLDGDGIPEIIVGTDVYKYTGNDVQLWRRCPLFIDGVEGTNTAADINLDGIVDVVYHDNESTSSGNPVRSGQIVVWTPLTNRIINIITSLDMVSRARSYTVVGDIDGRVINGKKYPEICFNGFNRMDAYQFDGINFTHKWTLPTNENSGLATFTFFDFNLDGVMELVYRDETTLHIYDASGDAEPEEKYFQPCSSWTGVETPIVADVTGDGSANIIVAGSGKVHVFEGAASKWASCPNVWNQQLYSPLLINRDLTVISPVESPAWNRENRDNDTVRYYNGGPMQVPFISSETYCTFDLAPDVYVVDGTIITTSNSVTFTITIANMGMAVAAANIPIQYYKNTIEPANIIGDGTLGVDLPPGQSTIITKTITDLSPMPSQFQVRVLDDGINFPASGAYSDCDLTNNIKTFGMLEITKIIDENTACVNSVKVFTVTIANNELHDREDIMVIDSLGIGWEFISATPSEGTTVGSYNPATREIIWTIPSLPTDSSVYLLLVARAITDGTLRNMAWIEEVDGIAQDRTERAAYAVVSAGAPPDAPIITVSGSLCPVGSEVTLFATGTGIFQWFLDEAPIVGATTSTYTTSTPGNYSITLSDGTCTSDLSAEKIVENISCIEAKNDTASTFSEKPVTINVLENDEYSFSCIPILSIEEVPVNGLAIISDNMITYISNAGFSGWDSLTYRLKCDEEPGSTAKLYIMVYDKPDNIVDEENCYVLTPSIDFKIKQQWQTSNVSPHVGTLVGDLDGDGLPEIITYSYDHTKLHIYNGRTRALTSIDVGSVYGSGGWEPHVAAVLVDADGNGMGEIITVNTVNRTIISYEADTTGGVFSLNIKWTSPRPFVNPYPNATALSGDNTPHPNVADFNGDGVPELLIYNQIYNAETGAFLGETAPIASAHMGCDPGRLATWNRALNFQTTADFDGDGLPEVVAGGRIYKINFNEEKTAVTSTVFKQHASVPDGFTAVADVDMDGHLDVIVASARGLIVTLYIWSPLTTWFTSTVVYTSSSNYPSHSFPFVGDIDGFTDDLTGKKHPEICLVISNASYTLGGYVYAYKYISSSKTLTRKWYLTTSDQSGGTGITLFDFNNDGINELVYRDQTHLRILNGVADNVIPVLADPNASFECRSGTAIEYPVIADTDGDGSANICVTCYMGTVSASTSFLRTYESGSHPWAPTRRVWNQSTYEPLQINENLTVPRMPLPKNIELNGKYPYNGSWIQVPAMANDDFSIVTLAPDPQAAKTWIEQLNASTARVWVRIKNDGVKFTNSSLPVALYGISPPPATADGSHIAVKPVGIGIAPGDSTDIYFDIPVTQITATLSIRIQDDGVKYPADGSYLDCNYNNNMAGIGLLALTDSVNTCINVPLPINILANDIYNCTPALLISDSPVNGTANIADDKINYIPSSGFTGSDSLAYKITCGQDESIAKIYIAIGDYPAAGPIIGNDKVCINSTITLLNSTADGVWSVSNPSVAQIVSSTADSVTIRGLSEGKVYVSYTIGALCQTTVTFNLKVLPEETSELRIGF